MDHDRTCSPTPAGGANTGFIRELTIPTGASNVCVSAVNQGPGDHTLLGCQGIPAWTPPTTTTIPKTDCDVNSGATISDCTIKNADFTGTYLAGKTFSNVTFIDVDFTGAHLHSVTIKDSSLTNVTFQDTQLHYVTLDGVDGKNTTFDGAKFGEGFGDVTIDDSNLAGSTFVETELRDTSFNNVNLHDIDMSDTTFFSGNKFLGTTSLLGLTTADGQHTEYDGERPVIFDDTVECPDATLAGDEDNSGTCFGAGWDARQPV